MSVILKQKNYSLIFFAGLFILSFVFSIVSELYYLALIPFVSLFFYVGWHSLRVLFLLLLFSLPFSMGYQFSDTLGTDFPDELLMLSVAVFFFCSWFYKPSLLSRKVLNHPLVLILFLCLSWMLLSGIFSTEPLISFKYILAKGWYIGSFVFAPLILFKEKEILKKAITVFMAAMILITIITLVRHFQYGFTFASINKALQPFFLNHVNYSAMLVCIIPIIFFYRQSLAKRNLKIAAGIVLGILMMALYFSYARGAWLAFIAGVFAGWLIKRKLLLFAFITFVIFVITFLFWIKSNDRYLRYAHDYKTTIWHANFRKHLEATYELKDVSTAERFYRWIAGVRMIKDRWLTGYGPNSFYNNYKPYTIPLFKTWVSGNPEHSTVHNYFLLITIEQGIPGLIFFLLLTGGMLLYAERLYHKTKDGFYKTVAITTGIILTMILVVNFLSDLIETDKIGSLFFLSLAMLVVTDINCRYQSNSSPDIQGVPQPVS
jgi:O-antigen ligase